MDKVMITRVAGFRLLGNTLSVVSLEGTENVVVANLEPNATSRWHVGETVAYIAEGSTIPDDVLKERGYWDEEKSRGLLGGKKYNQVKKRNFGPEEDRVESRGLLFKILNGPDANKVRPHLTRGSEEHDVATDELPRNDNEVETFLGIG